MEFSQSIIDLVRALHLLCFAAGMGIGLFFDWRSLQSMHFPITAEDLDVLHEIHTWISTAFIGLWVTGLMLVYIRTGFALEAFSPKLIAKLTVMTLMVLNARAIARYVLPVMRQNVGRPMFELPIIKLAGLSQVAINSVFCWMAGLALGSSVVLKTAAWEMLLPLLLGGFALFTIGGQLVIWALLLRHVVIRMKRRAGTGAVQTSV